MRKTREKSSNPKKIQLEKLEDEGEVEKMEIKSKKGFFACYLLTTLNPRFKGHTYVGFTVNPKRRIRQHNGEIGSGAYRTKKKRPWEMVVCIYGFPTNTVALQFEWAWQHPRKSLAVREAAATFKSLSGVTNKIKLAYTMLNLPSWRSLNLTVNYFSTKYTNSSSGCPSLPENMKDKVCPMAELSCHADDDDDDECCRDEEECEEAGNINGTVIQTETQRDFTNGNGEIASQHSENSNVNFSETPQEGRTEYIHDITENYLHSDYEVFSEDNELSNVPEKFADTTACILADDLSRSDILSRDYQASNANGRDIMHAIQERCLDTNVPVPVKDSDNIECFEACTMEKQRDSTIHSVDDRTPLVFFKSLAKTSSTVANISYAEDRGMLGSSKESAIDLEWSGGKWFPFVSAADQGLQPCLRGKKFRTMVVAGGGEESSPPRISTAVPRKVEVVDLLSPSPSDCRISSCRKKSRVSSVCSLIDLT